MTTGLPPGPPPHLQGLRPSPLLMEGKGGEGELGAGGVVSGDPLQCLIAYSYARTWKPGVTSPSSSSLGCALPVQAPVGAQPAITLCIPHWPNLPCPHLPPQHLPALQLMGTGSLFCCPERCFSPSLLEEEKNGEAHP